MATARVERSNERSGRSAIEQDEWLQPWDRPQAPQNALVLHRYDRHSYVNDDADDTDVNDDADDTDVNDDADDTDVNDDADDTDVNNDADDTDVNDDADDTDVNDDADDTDDAIATSTIAAHEQTVEELAWSGRPRRALASANRWALFRANPSFHAVQHEFEDELRQLPFSELDEWVQRVVPYMNERYGITYRFPLEPPH
jgi:hypothetical protein